MLPASQATGRCRDRNTDTHADKNKARDELCAGLERLRWRIVKAESSRTRRLSRTWRAARQHATRLSSNEPRWQTDSRVHVCVCECVTAFTAPSGLSQNGQSVSVTARYKFTVHLTANTWSTVCTYVCVCLQCSPLCCPHSAEIRAQRPSLYVCGEFKSAGAEKHEIYSTSSQISWENVAGPIPGGV